MRTVVLAMQMTLDGFVASPDGGLDWMWPTLTPDVTADIMTSVGRTTTQLMGRATYEAQAAHWPSSAEPIAPLINAMEKVVFSSTLGAPLAWEHARLATTDLAGTVAGLRRETGGDIAVTGGSALARAAVRAGLVDEYQLIVHPVAIGAGLPLFDTAVRLRLRDRRDYDNGVLRLTYVRPAE